MFGIIARGEELVLPNFGLETVHHVHADDVAQIVERAVGNWGGAVGEAFNAVSAQAVNLRGYAEAMYRYFGQTPKIGYLPFAEWKALQVPAEADATWEHIIRSPSHSIAKGQKLLGYAPRYTSIGAVEEAVAWLVADGQIVR